MVPGFFMCVSSACDSFFDRAGMVRKCRVENSMQMHVSVIIIPIVCTAACFGRRPVVLRTGGAEGDRHAYAEVSLGYSTFAMSNLNTYYIRQFSRQFEDRMRGGHAFDAEIGLCVGDIIKTGISYVQAKGVVESGDTLTFIDRDNPGREIQWDEWFLDSYYRGAGLGVRYYPLRMRRVRGFVGGRHTVGLGAVHLGMGTRPDSLWGDYGYDNFKAKGIGLSAITGAEFIPAPHLTFGLVCGYRMLRTEVLRDVIDGAPWRRPPADPHNINLDFSGFFIQVKAGFEM